MAVCLCVSVLASWCAGNLSTAYLISCLMTAETDPELDKRFKEIDGCVRNGSGGVHEDPQ